MALLVLVVDDDVELLAMLGMTLRGLGLDVVSASDAETAHAMLHGYLPDAVLLDVAMPRMDGFELLSEWRDAGFLTPVLLHTAHDTADVRLRALASGADDLVFKPAPADELVAKLTMAVDARKQVPS